MDYASGGRLDYVEAGGLRIARALHDFVTAEAIPGTGIDPAAFWRGLRRAGARPRAAQPGAAGPPRRAAAADRRLAPRASRPADRPATPIRRSCATIGYLVPEPPDFAIDTGACRSRDRQHRRAAACRAGDQRALCAERRQRALGQPVRCAVRHRRDPGGRRRDARRRLSTSVRGAQGDRARPRHPRPGGAACRRQPCRRGAAMRWTARRWRSR